MENTERRKSLRIEDDTLSLKIDIGEFNTITHTLNISESGIYCKVDKELPIMSRVKIILMMPESQDSERAAKHIEVEGVVVREHPVIIDGDKKHYDVAIFFDNLSPRNKEIISGYIAKKKT